MEWRGSFWDYVKNPSLFWKEARVMERIDKLRAPRDAKINALVAAMAKRKSTYEELQRLRRAGERVVSPLVVALREPKFLFHKYGPGVLDGSPMETALDLLVRFAEPPFAVLEPVLRHEDESFRSRALYHVAQCGHDDAIPALEAGLASPSEKCRTWALMGLEFLSRTGRGSERFRRTLFDAAAQRLKDDDFNIAEHAPRALLVLNRERAVNVLLGDEVLRSDNRNVWRALEALKDADVPVPAVRLRTLLAAIRGKVNDYPFDNAYAEGLILLARAEGKGAMDVIAEAQALDNQRIKEHAAKAIAIAAGVQDPYAMVMDRFEEAGVGGLSNPQLYYLTLYWLDCEVKNGGFSQYFFNPSGDLAGHAVDAAKAVGAPEVTRIIQEAVALFDPAGPSPNRKKRLNTLSGLSRESLEKLNTQYYECCDQLEELLPLYVAKNPDEFRSRHSR